MLPTNIKGYYQFVTLYAYFELDIRLMKLSIHPNRAPPAESALKPHTTRPYADANFTMFELTDCKTLSIQENGTKCAFPTICSLPLLF